MITPQTGIFALGDAAQIYVEFSLIADVAPIDLIRTAASFHEPRTTVGGVNLVIGFRPELWASVAPHEAPEGVEGFNTALRGPDGFAFPATQADLWMWFAGATYDILWDSARGAMRAMRGIAKLEREISGWSYRHSRDLTGFEDGTENPNVMDAPEVALVPTGARGAGASILLFQQWRHLDTWYALSDAQQEAAMGRTKDDSTEFDEAAMPPSAHVARARDVVDGAERKIFRRNVPYGNLEDYGTVFVGFSAERSRLQRMLERMAGIEDGIRDALTQFTTPLTGAYYVIPSVTALKAFADKPSAESDAGGT